MKALGLFVITLFIAFNLFSQPNKSKNEIAVYLFQPGIKSISRENLVNSQRLKCTDTNYIVRRITVYLIYDKDSSLSPRFFTYDTQNGFIPNHLKERFKLTPVGTKIIFDEIYLIRNKDASSGHGKPFILELE